MRRALLDERSSPAAYAINCTRSLSDASSSAITPSKTFWPSADNFVLSALKRTCVAPSVGADVGAEACSVSAVFFSSGFGASATAGAGGAAGALEGAAATGGAGGAFAVSVGAGAAGAAGAADGGDAGAGAAGAEATAAGAGGAFGVAGAAAGADVDLGAGALATLAGAGGRLVVCVDALREGAEPGLRS